MGKDKRQRALTRHSRLNPTGLISLADIEADVAAYDPPPLPNVTSSSHSPSSSSSSGEFPILQKIDHVEASEREGALRTLADIVVGDPAAVEILLKGDTLKRMVYRLCDPVLDVRIAAFGALRNITNTGDITVCEALLKADCVTVALSEFTTAIVALKDAVFALRIESILQLLIQNIALLSNLCENVEKAVDIICCSNLLPQVVSLLQPSIYPYELVLTVGQFLIIVTDCNPTAHEQVLSIPGYPQAASRLINDTAVPTHVRMLLAAIDANIQGSEQCLAHSSTLLMQVLDVDWNTALNSLFAGFLYKNQGAVIAAMATGEAVLVTDGPLPKTEERVEEDDTSIKSTDEEMETEKQVQVTSGQLNFQAVDQETLHVRQELDNFKESIRAQQLAIEIVTNVCFNDMPFFPSDSMQEDDIQGDDEVEEPQQVDEAVDTSSQSPIWSLRYFDCVHRLCQPLNVNTVYSDPQFMKTDFMTEILALFMGIQQRAVICVSNALLDAGAKTHIAEPQKIWETMCAVVGQAATAGALLNIELMESATSAMWTMLRLFATKTIQLTPSHENVAGMLQLARTPLSDSLRANSIGMLGIVGQLPEFTSAVSEIGSILLQSLQDNSSQVIAEALNSIFDIFAETSFNHTVKALDMLRILEMFVPFLKNKIRTEKKLLEQIVWDRLDESHINLVRFIKYKKSQF